MIEVEAIERLLQLYDQAKHDLRIFMNTVLQYIGEHPDLIDPGREVIHSYKSRLKNRDHLRDKIQRKSLEGRQINEANLFREVTDLAGVRILLLFQDHFRSIDTVVRKKVAEGDWHLSELPKAYTWDPENAAFFRQFDLEVAKSLLLIPASIT